MNPILPAPSLSLPQPGTVPAPAGRNTGAISNSAEQFAAIAYTELLTPIFATNEAAADGLFGGGSAEKMIQPMLVAEIAKAMARQDQRGEGLGITLMLKGELARIAAAGGKVP